MENENSNHVLTKEEREKLDKLSSLNPHKIFVIAPKDNPEVAPTDDSED